MIHISSVNVYPSTATVAKGKWYYGAYASIASDCPECAEVRWYSNNSSIASVNATTGYIYGVNTGTTRIYAKATDGSGKKDYITVTVAPPVSVTGVSVCPTSLTMNVGDTDYLCETVYPSNATNQTVTWCSSDDSVAEVNTYSGKVTAKKAGAATITATTADGGFVGTCELRVVIDTVTITKDGDYSNVVFGSGKVWKCNIFTYFPSTDSIRPIDNERIIHNRNIDFTEKELGFLYRIDPNGVIHYVKEKDLGQNATPTNYLIYRDNIFKEIYGRSPRFFTYENSQLYYHTGVNDSNRYDVYSEAELIFGMLPRWSWEIVDDILQEIVLGMIISSIPGLSQIVLTYEIVTAFFFTDAFDGKESSAASSFRDNLIEASNVVDWLGIFEWANIIVGLIESITESVLPPEINAEVISIYESAHENENYLIKVSDNNQTVDLTEFIEHYKELLLE